LQSVTQNDQVLVIVVNGFFPTSGDTFTVTDTQGNTFSQVGSQIAGYQLSYAFVATAKTTSADTVSVVNSTGQDLFIGVLPRSIKTWEHLRVQPVTRVSLPRVRATWSVR